MSGSTDSINILQLTKPTIELEKLSIDDTESGLSNDNAEQNPDGDIKDGIASEFRRSKMYNLFPLVEINGIEFQWPDDIEAFELRNTGFKPTIHLSILDNANYMTSKTFPCDGDVIKLYIRSPWKEDVYKPIRIDFMITSLK